jgi:hypothetical protein
MLLLDEFSAIGNEFPPGKRAPAPVITGRVCGLAGTNIILAVNSFGGGQTCDSNTYSYRVDTPEALTWIADAIRLGGGSL